MRQKCCLRKGETTVMRGAPFEGNVIKLLTSIICSILDYHRLYSILHSSMLISHLKLNLKWISDTPKTSKISKNIGPWPFPSKVVILSPGIFHLSTRACWHVKASTYWAPTSWQPLGTVFLVSLLLLGNWPPSEYPHQDPSTLQYSKILGSLPPHTWAKPHTNKHGKRKNYSTDCLMVCLCTSHHLASGQVQFYISSIIKIKAIVQTPRQWMLSWTWKIQWITVDFLLEWDKAQQHILHIHCNLLTFGNIIIHRFEHWSSLCYQEAIALPLYNSQFQVGKKVVDDIFYEKVHLLKLLQDRDHDMLNDQHVSCMNNSLSQQRSPLFMYE